MIKRFLIEEDKKYHEDTRSENQIIEDIGIFVYTIYGGSTYQAMVNYHQYKIRFKKSTNEKGAFCQVYSDIYEDNIRICNDVIIGFWPFHPSDNRCGDMELSSMKRESIEKYDDIGIYMKMLDELMEIWNFYYEHKENKPIFIRECNYKEKEKRDEIIREIENVIDSGQTEKLKPMASTIWITSYKTYNSLSKFLNESGVVYKVENDFVYIWDDYKKEFKKLIGYKYYKEKYKYLLYVL